MHAKNKHSLRPDAPIIVHNSLYYQQAAVGGILLVMHVTTEQ